MCNKYHREVGRECMWLPITLLGKYVIEIILDSPPVFTLHTLLIELHYLQPYYFSPHITYVDYLYV
jgi:hypothetical protein